MVGNTSKQQAICFPFEGFLSQRKMILFTQEFGHACAFMFLDIKQENVQWLSTNKVLKSAGGEIKSGDTSQTLTLLGGRGVIGIYWRDQCQWLQHRLKRRPPCVQRQVCQGLLVYSVWNLWYRNSDWASSRRKDLRQEAGTTEFFYIRWGRQERPLGHL